MHSSLVVAQTFLNLAKKDSVYLSGGKLHKLVYFAQAIYVGAYGGTSLIDEDIKAWNFGPIIPELFNLVMQYGNKVLPYELPLIGVVPFKQDTKEYTAISSTWLAYKGANDAQLKIVSTLPGTPWDQVWSDQSQRYMVIPPHIFQAYYEAQFKPKSKNEVIMQNLRDQEMLNRIAAYKKGSLIAGSELRRRLRLTDDELASAVRQARLFAVEGPDGEKWYPAFFADDRYSRDMVEKVSAALGDMPGASKWEFFTTRKMSLAGRVTLDALYDGDVEHVLRSANGFRERSA